MSSENDMGDASASQLTEAWEWVARIKPYCFELALYNDGWRCEMSWAGDNSRKVEAYGGRCVGDYHTGEGAALAIVQAAKKLWAECGGEEGLAAQHEQDRQRNIAYAAHVRRFYAGLVDELRASSSTAPPAPSPNL